MKNVKKGDWFLCENHVYHGSDGVVILECIKSYKTERFAKVVWAENKDVMKSATTSWRGVYPNHQMKYRDGRVVRNVSAVPIRRQHWEKMRKLRGDEKERWKLMIEM